MKDGLIKLWMVVDARYYIISLNARCPHGSAVGSCLGRGASTSGVGFGSVGKKRTVKRIRLLVQDAGGASLLVQDAGGEWERLER